MLRRRDAVFLLMTASGIPQIAWSQDVTCASAILWVEQQRAYPPRLLDAIAQKESGHWPWIINADGTAYRFETKEQAISTTRTLLRQGAGNIDIGCMQVSIMQHPTAFASLDEAFDPYKNTTYASNFLTDLAIKYQDWFKATAAYHNARPDQGYPYALDVGAIERSYLGYGSVLPKSTSVPRTSAAMSTKARVQLQDFVFARNPPLRTLAEQSKPQ